MIWLAQQAGIDNRHEGSALPAQGNVGCPEVADCWAAGVMGN